MVSSCFKLIEHPHTLALRMKTCSKSGHGMHGPETQARPDSSGARPRPSRQPCSWHCSDGHPTVCGWSPWYRPSMAMSSLRWGMPADQPQLSMDREVNPIRSHACPPPFAQQVRLQSTGDWRGGRVGAKGDWKLGHRPPSSPPSLASRAGMVGGTAWRSAWSTAMTRFCSMCCVRTCSRQR